MTLRMPAAVIEYPREWADIHPPVRGMVTSIGASGQAAVRIYRWDEHQGRMVPADRLIAASYEEDKKTGVVAITGRSELLVNEQHLTDADATITLTATPGKNCKNCR